MHQLRSSKTNLLFSLLSLSMTVFFSSLANHYPIMPTSSCLIITQDLNGLLNYFHIWSLKEREVHLIHDQIRNDLLICQCNLLMYPHLNHVLQLMLMQLRQTSTQVDYTHKKPVRAYHSLGTLPFSTKLFLKRRPSDRIIHQCP